MSVFGVLKVVGFQSFVLHMDLRHISVSAPCTCTTKAQKVKFHGRPWGKYNQQRPYATAEGAINEVSAKNIIVDLLGGHDLRCVFHRLSITGLEIKHGAQRGCRIRG
jgi:hypothetical protein